MKYKCKDVYFNIKMLLQKNARKEKKSLRVLAFAVALVSFRIFKALSVEDLFCALYAFFVPFIRPIIRVYYFT